MENERQILKEIKNLSKEIDSASRDNNLPNIREKYFERARRYNYIGQYENAKTDWEVVLLSDSLKVRAYEG